MFSPKATRLGWQDLALPRCARAYLTLIAIPGTRSRGYGPTKSIVPGPLLPVLQILFRSVAFVPTRQPATYVSRL